MQWFMWLGIALTFPLSYPISAILDKILGAEVGLVMSKGMMKKFFQMQQEKGELSVDEKKILVAALELNRKEVKEVMTPINEVYMLEINTVIDKQILKEIY